MLYVMFHLHKNSYSLLIKSMLLSSALNACSHHYRGLLVHHFISIM